MQYVSASTLARYEQYNRPFRGFLRHCETCKSEVHVTPAPSPPSEDSVRATTDRVRKALLEELGVGADIVAFFDRAANELVQFTRSGADVYNELLDRLDASGPPISPPLAARLRYGIVQPPTRGVR